MQSNKRWFVGMDGGGTKTTAALCDEVGQVAAVVTGGASNMMARARNEVAEVLRELYERVLDEAGVRETDVERIVLGLAGADRPEVKEAVLSSFYLHGAGVRIQVDNDAICALHAGTWGEPGIVLIAGTGSIAYGVNRFGERFRTGGWGYLLGDEGSGYDLGRRAVSAVLHAFDGRGPETQLTEELLRMFRVNRPDEIISLVYNSSHQRAALAGVSRVLGKVVKAGDPVAQELVAGAVESLADMVKALEKRMGKGYPVVLAGGLFSSDSWFLEWAQPVLAQR
ncbi:MAG: N-acetylglucosamine kinase, partial [Clostridia bacterium]